MQILDFGVNFELAETSILQQIESHLLPELHESNGRLVAKRDKLNLYGEGGFFKPHQVLLICLLHFHRLPCLSLKWTDRTFFSPFQQVIN